MAKSSLSDLSDLVFLGAGAFILGDIALKGAFGSSVQQAVATFVNALGIHASISVNPSSGSASASSGASSSGGAPSSSSAGGSPPSRCAFIPWGQPNAQFVQDNHNGTWTVVVGGRVIGTYSALQDAENAYNAALGC